MFSHLMPFADQWINEYVSPATIHFIKLNIRYLTAKCRGRRGKLAIAFLSKISCPIVSCVCTINPIVATRGAETRGGYIRHNNLTVSPQWFKYGLLLHPLQWFDYGVHLSADLHLNLGKKSVSFLVKTFFFGLYLISSSEKIVVEVHPPQCWK